MPDDITQLAKIAKSNVSYIEKAHRMLFLKKRSPRAPHELRPNKVLVSLSETDMEQARKLMGEGETYASHVYTYYKKGVDETK